MKNRRAHLPAHSARSLLPKPRTRSQAPAVGRLSLQAAPQEVETLLREQQAVGRDPKAVLPQFQPTHALLRSGAAECSEAHIRIYEPSSHFHCHLCATHINGCPLLAFLHLYTSDNISSGQRFLFSTHACTARIWPPGLVFSFSQADCPRLVFLLLRTRGSL